MVRTIELSVQDLLEQVRQGRIPANATARVTYDESPPVAANGHAPTASATDAERDSDLPLFEQWAREDADATPEEIEEERRLFDRLHQNINETRRASGMRTL